MKRKLAVALMVMAVLMMLGACGGIQMAGDDQDALVRIAARTAGYAVGKNNPELIDQVCPYLDTYLTAATLQDAVIRQGVAVLLERVDDPIIQANIRDAVSLVEVARPPDDSQDGDKTQLAFDETRLRNALVGFREGLELARTVAG